LRRCSFEKLNKKSGIQDFKKSSKSTSKSSWTPQVLHAPVEKQLYSHKRKRKERKNQRAAERAISSLKTVYRGEQKKKTCSKSMQEKRKQSQEQPNFPKSNATWKGSLVRVV